MTAVDIEDAWGGSIFNGPPPPATARVELPVEALPISAKEARVAANDMEVRAEPSLDATFPHRGSTNDDLTRVLFEVQQLRREEARRSTMYMIALCVVSVVGYLYVDHLNRKISRLAYAASPSPWHSADAGISPRRSVGYR